MGGIGMAMEIARKALFANQVEMQVTSNNIANVNTPGYSRQTAIETETPASSSSAGQLGTGVEVSKISRIVDNYTNNQLNSENSVYAGLDYTSGAVGQIESLFNPNSGSSISNAINEFYAAWGDLSANPQGAAERQTVVSDADLLASEVRSADQQLSSMKSTANKDVPSIVGDINQMVKQIASLNGTIKVNNTQGVSPNTLMDQRDALLTQLGQKIGFTSLTDQYGQVSIFVGSGRALVDGERAGSLIADVNPTTATYDVKIQLPGQTGNINQFDTITNKITNGQLGAAISFRDGYVKTVRDQLDQLAYGITNQVNALHAVGYGLSEGNPPTVPTGFNFFAQISDVTGAASNFQVDSSVLNDVQKVAAAGATKASGSIVFAGVPAVSPAPSPSITIGGTTYDFFDSSAGAYAGANTGIDLNGAKTTGDVASRIAAAPAGAGFTMQARGGMLLVVAAADGLAGNAITMSAAGNDPSKSINLSGATLAGGVDIPAPPPPSGDNRNALIASGLGNMSIAYLGNGATPSDYVAGMLGQIGSVSKGIASDLQQQKTIVANLKQRQQEVSGVSLNEEMTNLITFQRAFEAASKMITIVDQMLATIINMKSSTT